MWKAIRYRGGQSLVLVFISALVATCAAFAPLFSRSIDQALLRATLGRLEAADLKLSVLASRTEDSTLAASAVEAGMPGTLSQWYAPGLSMTTDDTQVVPIAGKKPSPVRIVARDEICDHVTLSEGACPTKAPDLLVSAADAKVWGWKVGTTLTLQNDVTQQVAYTISGTYTVKDDPDYWLRTELQGKSGNLIDFGDLVPGIDDFIVTPEGVENRWQNAQLSVDYRLRTSAITLDSLARAGAAVAALRPPNQANVDSPLPEIASQVDDGQTLVRQLVPLLIAQLVAVALAVLVLVAGAAVAQRRPEIAVSRLRGRSREASRRLVMAELGFTVLLGLPLGLLLAVGLSEAVRRFILPPGVPFELGWQVPLAAAVAGVASLAVVYAAARPVLREPIASLLRRVPPVTAARTLRVGDVILIVLAAVGVVGIVTDQISGPLAILTPTLLALAAGALLGAVVVVVATRLGRRALDSGSLGSALAGLAIARRPTTRHVLLVVTAVSALVVFAANAVAVADRNRENRAELTVGAFGALRTGSKDPTAVARVVDGLPAGQREHAMPVGIVSQRDPDSTTTLAARPEQLRRIAYAPSAQAALALDKLALPDQLPVRLRGSRLTGSVTYDVAPLGYGFGERPADVPPEDWMPGKVTGQPLRLGISVTTPEGEVLTRDLGTLPGQGKGTVAVDAPLLCPQGCRLQSLWLRLDPGVNLGLEAVKGSVDISGIALDAKNLGVDARDGWQQPRGAVGDQSNTGAQLEPGRSAEGTDEAAPVDSVALAAAPGGGLRLSFTNTGRVAAINRADAPALIPALLSGRIPIGGDAEKFDVQSLAGRTTPAMAEQRVPALPFVGNRGALVNLDLMLRIGGRLPPSGSMEVWIDSQFPGGVAGAEKALRAGGLEVLGTRSFAQDKRLLDESATGWGLLLGLFTAVLSLLLAAVMLVVVSMTTGRIVTRDIAALRVAGVSGRDLRRAAVREALAPVLVAAVVGALCGVVGAVLAMPLIPLFDTPAPVPALDFSPAWLVMGLAWLVAVLILVLVAAVLALRAARRGDSDRLREAW
ncbi:FtsX-like permease family protein [Knoellia sp. CPCC 206453]|uniref:FtsX-like permease family protein n=1 Tax=Knoellia pratensis TaxID=3404796 RepID=UPI0036241F05